MHVSPEQSIYSKAPLQLLLFVYERPSSQQQIEQIRHCLKELQAEYPFALQVVNVAEASVAKHLKLVTTPALIKIYPEPRQTLAGSNLLSQLKNWWFHWQHAVEHLRIESVAESIDRDYRVSTPKTLSSVPESGELRLADEVFHLKHEQEKLLEQLHFKDQVISMLAHDLRNPLTAVSIAIETLESNLVSHKGDRLTPALTSRLFKQARTQTRTIERMITGLLQVASDTVAELHIQPQKLELGKLCQDVIAQVSDRARAKSQDIETNIPNDLPCVYADLERVGQVLTNLLDNAIKYTPIGGIIRICGFHRTTQKIQISVYDTGPGIPEADRDDIFAERFHLEHDAAKAGYGIGLSLCQLIIQAHYGQLWVDSPPTGGSCFHFTLPVYPN